MEESLSKLMAESARRHEENSNLIKEIRASMDVAIKNQGALIIVLEIQIGKMNKVLGLKVFLMLFGLLLLMFVLMLLNMDQDSAHMVAASKVPMLKPGKFEIWRMRIEQYIQMIDYALWEVIENGATLPKTTIVEGVMTEMPITTAEEKA
ncbi:hypothetical protein Tco_1261073 [Tanacetum coccineum]